jgi:riboflavin kinase/FMN adenylyltransferase
MSLPPPIGPRFPVIRDGTPVPSELSGGFAAIGNFDGVHRGHRAALDAALALARSRGRPALALTFEPHPRRFFLPDAPTFRLTPEPAKLRLLAAAGIDAVAILAFDAALAGRSAEEFVRDILVARLRLGGVVVGDNFRFGRKRLGTTKFLREEGARHGLEVKILDRVAWRGIPVSSGIVRAALGAGDIPGAEDFLGHSWFVEGTVERGAQRGRELGFPTANLALDPDCGLKHGIYAVRTYLAGARHDSVASFGRRPQFDNGPPLLEVLLFDFDADLYGRSLDVEFVAFIRPERRFDTVEALQAQMQRDCDAARAILAGGIAPAGKA